MMDIFDHPRFNALLNVIVFTPIAVYLAQGRRPPTWLTVASLAYTGIIFARDLQTLLGGADPTGAQIPRQALQPPTPKSPPRLPSPAPSSRVSAP